MRRNPGSRDDAACCLYSWRAWYIVVILAMKSWVFLAAGIALIISSTMIMLNAGDRSNLYLRSRPSSSPELFAPPPPCIMTSDIAGSTRASPSKNAPRCHVEGRVYVGAHVFRRADLPDLLVRQALVHGPIQRTSPRTTCTLCHAANGCLDRHRPDLKALGSLDDRTCLGVISFIWHLRMAPMTLPRNLTILLVRLPSVVRIVMLVHECCLNLLDLRLQSLECCLRLIAIERTSAQWARCIHRSAVCNVVVCNGVLVVGLLRPRTSR